MYQTVASTIGTDVVYVITTTSSGGTTTLTVGVDWGSNTTHGWGQARTCPRSSDIQKVRWGGPRLRSLRTRRPQQPAEVRPWMPKLVLRELATSWAASVRAFACR